MCEARLRPAAGTPIGSEPSSFTYRCSTIIEVRMSNCDGVHGKPYVLGFEIVAAVADIAAGYAFWQLNMRSMASEPVTIGATMSNDG
jgi:hypothetical protein